MPVDVGVWACVCSSIRNERASRLCGTSQFIKCFTSIIPLSPHETLRLRGSRLITSIFLMKKIRLRAFK